MRTFVVSFLALLLLSAQAKPPAPSDFPGLETIDERQEWVAPGETPPFNPSSHIKLVGAAKQCSETLARAQWRQDIFLQADSDAHFDNCSFPGGLAYIEQLEGDIDTLDLRKHPESVNAAVELAGRALHAIQDFYAHSNYVELMAKDGRAFDAKQLVIPVWTKAGREEVQKLAQQQRLVSGRVWWDDPKLCAASVPTHGELAKDSEDLPEGKKRIEPWKRNGYRAAFELADFATRQFLVYAYERWPQLKTTCGPVIVYLPVMDRRPDPPKPVARAGAASLPVCRLDRRMEPLVGKTLQHVLDAAKRNGVAVPARIAVNPETPADDVLSLQLVGDLPVGMADEDGCPIQGARPASPLQFDAYSIRGLCQAVSSKPALIRCSGEEVLRIASEDQAKNRPSAAMAYIFAHELSHVVHADRSHFQAASRVIDLSQSSKEKRHILYQLCEGSDPRHEADRKQEERADDEALIILRDLVQHSPYRDLGTLEGAAITQNAMSLERASLAAHAWLASIGEDAPLPRRLLAVDLPADDKKAREVARGLLCDVERTTKGRITLPLNANGTHPSEVDRLAHAHDVLAAITPVVPKVEGNVVQQSEQLLAGLEQFQKETAAQSAAFFANVGRCICEDVDTDRSELCKGVAIVAPLASLRR